RREGRPVGGVRGAGLRRDRGGGHRQRGRRLPRHDAGRERRQDGRSCLTSDAGPAAGSTRPGLRPTPAGGGPGVSTGPSTWSRPPGTRTTATSSCWPGGCAVDPDHGGQAVVGGGLPYLRHRLPGTPVVVDCHTPGQAAVLHHAEHPDVLFTDTLWRLACEHTDAEGAIEFCRRAVADPGVRPAVATGVEMLLSASVVHLIGGGYVNDQWQHHLGVAAAAGEVGGISGARVVATGQGFLPCGDAGLLADALRGFDLVSVRDALSYDLLTGTGV